MSGGTVEDGQDLDSRSTGFILAEFQGKLGSHVEGLVFRDELLQHDVALLVAASLFLQCCASFQGQHQHSLPVLELLAG